MSVPRRAWFGESHATSRAQALLATVMLSATIAACAPTVAPMGPPVTSPSFDDAHLVMADGARLPLRSWRPDGEVRAVVLALHGFNETSKSFAIPAEAWAKIGILTYAYDQRGFGAAPHRGLWPGAETLVADLDAATAIVAARHPDMPLYVLGESMGGAVAVVAFARGQATAAHGGILVAPAVRGWTTFNVFARAGLWFFAHTIPWLAGRPQGLTFRPTDNVEALRALANDPLVIKDTRIDAAWGLVNLMDDALEAAPLLTKPMLILLGGRDELISNQPNALLLRRLPSAPREQLRVAQYANGYHMLLRDLQSSVVHRDVAFWIATRERDPGAPLPSGAELAATTHASAAPAEE